MHVICLGVTRTLLKALAIKKGENYSMCSWQISNIPAQLENLKKETPKEFSRKPTSLFDLERWKATELSQFLLYFGPCILKSILSKERYIHFLKLSVATRILLQEESNENKYDFAQHLLKDFVEDITKLYDQSFLTCNFHHLLHIHTR